MTTLYTTVVPLIRGHLGSNHGTLNHTRIILYMYKYTYVIVPYFGQVGCQFGQVECDRNKPNWTSKS